MVNVLAWECTVYVLFVANAINKFSITHGYIYTAYAQDDLLTFLLSRRSTPSASSREKFVASDFFCRSLQQFRENFPPREQKPYMYMVFVP